jgi:hypothetical protein
MITKVIVAIRNVLIALRYISMILAFELDTNCQGFLIVLKLLFVISKFTVAARNILIALRYISMILAKELDPNC